MDTRPYKDLLDLRLAFPQALDKSVPQLKASSAQTEVMADPSSGLEQYLFALWLWQIGDYQESIAAIRHAVDLGFRQDLCAWLLLINFKDAPVASSSMFDELPDLLSILAPFKTEIPAVAILQEYLQPYDGAIPRSPLLKDFLASYKDHEVTIRFLSNVRPATRRELSQIPELREVASQRSSSVLVSATFEECLATLKSPSERPALLIIDQELISLSVGMYRKLQRLGYTSWCELPGTTLLCSTEAKIPPTLFGDRTFIPSSHRREYHPRPEAHLKLQRTTTQRSSTLSILHTVEFYAPNVGGAELVVQRISEGLAERGHRVEVATTHNPQRRSPTLGNVTVHGFEVSGSLGNGISGPDIQRYYDFIQNSKADIIMHYAAQQWATDLALHVVGLNPKRTTILAPCGYSALADYRTLRWPQFGNYFRTILPTVLPRFDACIYHSTGYQDVEFARALGISNDHYIPNGVDLDEFRTKPQISVRQKYGLTGKHILLCVANFMAGKGHDRIIAALRHAPIKDVSVLLMGRDGGTLPGLRQQAQGLPIVFAEAPPRADIVAAYQEASLFIFASLIEATPLCILEAKANHLPWVSTDCGNLRELSGGIITPIATMMTTIEELLANPERCRQLGTEGYREVEASMSWPTIIDRYEQLYLQLHESKLRGAGAMVAPQNPDRSKTQAQQQSSGAH